jgi:hypothetical protein
MFSSVVDALEDSQKQDIVKFGFESLLNFQKCFVSNKFVKWLVRNVNYKSADIILKGDVMPLTVESVHLILGLPMSGASFPSECNAGKIRILPKFEKLSMPKDTILPIN